MSKYRNRYCGKITEKDVDSTVTVAGFIANIRDHGGVIFVDVRDSSGVIQVVSNDDNIFKGLTKESAVTITGLIRKRNEDDYNDHIKTGTIELLVDQLEILGKAPNELPFEIMKTSVLHLSIFEISGQ